MAGRHRARLVDDHDEGHVGLLLPVADAHVDGQRLLDRRLLVAAGAIALRPADHDQALAEIAHVHLERRQLAVAQAESRHVDHDDAVVAGEAGEVGRQRLGHDAVHGLALALERRDELGRDLVVAGEHERPRCALDDGVRIGAVVLAERVASRFDDDPEGMEPGLGRRHLEGHGRGAGLEVDRLRLDQRTVREEPHRRRLGDRRPNRGDGLDRLAEVGRRRGREPLDQHLVDRSGPDPARLDHDTLRRGERRLGLPAAGRVVAVGEQHDPLLRPVWEEGRGQSQGGADVGRRLDRDRRDPVELVHVRRQPLDERLLAERDNPGDVTVRLVGETLAQERDRVLAAGIPDGIRQVDDEDRGQPVDRQDHLEPGECQDQDREQCRPHQERDPPAPRSQMAARREVDTEGQGKDGDEQEQRERSTERDPHHALPSVARPNRAARPRRTRTMASRW